MLWPVARPDGRMMPGRRRVRIVELVSEDQNSTYRVGRDMGPPTGEDDVFIPCEGIVEMAHVHELLDGAVLRRRERARLRALYLPERQDQLRRQLLDFALDAVEQKRGRSSFGYGGSKQRESR